MITNIEDNDDFWYPNSKEEYIKNNLDIFNARSRGIGEGEKNLATHPFFGVPINSKFVTKWFSPNIVLGIYLPILLGFLWIVSIIWALVDIIH
ncbi:hypothetical protein [Nitrosarchaeum sp. AC2]|uniref:hypothetical protein n=1 Tax=Nitrosarchaeum sp. AC2 TaxID=2259673 RepID=UPI0015CAF9A8|nr:hypothetical protein [Nitrosarchaeum sp. AC2]